MIQNELRVGNWVIDDLIKDEEIIQIKSIQEIGDYKPIPITEEWLTKFGFEKYNEEGGDWHTGKLFTNHGEYNFCLSETWSYLFCFPAEGYNAPAQLGDTKYVHQLQNLYFWLTGIELICGELAGADPENNT